MLALPPFSGDMAQPENITTANSNAATAATLPGRRAVSWRLLSKATNSFARSSAQPTHNKMGGLPSASTVSAGVAVGTVQLRANEILPA